MTTGMTVKTDPPLSTTRSPTGISTSKIHTETKWSKKLRNKVYLTSKGTVMLTHSQNLSYFSLTTFFIPLRVVIN